MYSFKNGLLWQKISKNTQKVGLSSADAYNFFLVTANLLWKCSFIIYLFIYLIIYFV